MEMSLISKVCVSGSCVLASFSNDLVVPSIPASRMHNRQRGEETPSHPGGLSESARQKLEEHRRNRERQKGTWFGTCFECSLYDFFVPRGSNGSKRTSQ